MSLVHVETNALGVTREFHIDEKGNVTVNAKQDLEPFIEFTKRRQIDRGKTIDSEYANTLGLVPAVIALKWLNEEGWWIYDADKCEDVQKKLKAKLNDPDWRLIRTSELRV